MKKIAFVASCYNEIEAIKKDIGNISNIDVFKYGTEPEGYDFVEYNVRTNKQYAEILDLAQLISHHGFVDTDHYSPPQRGLYSDINKQALDEATKDLCLENLVAILDPNDLVPINRKMYDIKIEELKNVKIKLNDMDPLQLINKMEVTDDPVTIIAIVVTLFSKLYGETYTAKNGKEVNNFRTPNAVTWISELWSELLPKQDTYHQRKYIKSLKTRSRNMLKDKSSVWGLRFFIEWLISEDTPEPELEATDNNSHIIKIDGIEVEIEDSDIPFSLLFLVPLLEYSSHIQGLL